MNMEELIATSPISTQRTTRPDAIRAITSCQPGKIVPLHFIPLLREDQVVRGDIRISFDMAETLYPLLNAVNLYVCAHFVSPLAFTRFDGFDAFNRSYQGIPEPSTGLVIPFHETMVFSKAHQFWKALGVQWAEGTTINRTPLEAYNTLVNWRRRARTDKLPERSMVDTSLAEAFWRNTVVRGVVPDWDQSAMEGEVALSFAKSAVPVRGLVRSNTAQSGPYNYMDPATLSWAGTYTPVGTMRAYVQDNGVASAAASGYGAIYTELKDAGVTVTLANLELAKQTAAFAQLRERFDGIDDDYIIDLLMEGIRVPDEAMKQPILLDSVRTVFGMEERHAMDGDNLDMSRTTGQTSVSLRFRTPPMNTGGIILITAEIVPEQLQERLRDQYLASTNPSVLPNFMRDFLDPEKVEVVQNQRIDVYHATPTGTFGYAPLNWFWKRNYTKAGGKFYRPHPDTFVEDRMRFWSTEQANPTLADDFYMVRGLTNTVFADTVSDPFEVVTIGTASIVGNTVFGDELVEDSGSYDQIMGQVDKNRIVIPGSLTAPADEGGEADA